MTLNELQSVLVELSAAVDDHLDTDSKYNKTQSKRIRLLLGEIKNSTPMLRAELVTADKAN